MTDRPPLPPPDLESALAKVQAAESAPALATAVFTARIVAPGRPQPSRVFNSRRITLPVEVLGRSGANRTERGSL
jgi:hypothetical protein